MDIPDIAGIQTKLQRFLKRFQSCSADERTRDYFRLYTTALISNLSRKNCEAIALQAGLPVRSVQWFLARQVWDHKQMRNKLQKIIAKKTETNCFFSHAGTETQRSVFSVSLWLCVKYDRERLP